MADSLHERIIRRIVRQYDKPLIENSYRGAYVECMIAEALGDAWRPVGGDWGPWDLECPDGARLEVKQSAVLQSWSQLDKTPSAQSSTYDIKPKTGYWPDGVTWVPLSVPARLADIYVFAWHPVADRMRADHRDANQWQFFVLPERALPPDQKSISLNPLRRLTAGVAYRRLAEKVSEAVAGLATMKRDHLGMEKQREPCS